MQSMSFNSDCFSMCDWLLPCYQAQLKNDGTVSFNKRTITFSCAFFILLVKFHKVERYFYGARSTQTILDNLMHCLKTPIRDSLKIFFNEANLIY